MASSSVLYLAVTLSTGRSVTALPSIEGYSVSVKFKFIKHHTS